VALRMIEDATLEDDGSHPEKDERERRRELSAEETARARAEALDALVARGSVSGGAAASNRSAADLWRTLELLTGTLSGELAEQLRLILEPTLASRLQGDFRTGKRLNMRKIIPYVASEFRKDKIWLRRSKPSARKYQVVLAIDDSKSMAENACGHLALESMVMLARAMARLEVGEIGVVGFGGAEPEATNASAAEEDDPSDARARDGPNAASGPSPPRTARFFHPLGAPFTDQGGPALVSAFSFARDNTLADAPMAELLEYLDATLEAARERLRGGGEKLQQLCLVVADGRFHEKEALRRRMREMAAKPGVLVAFIVLDNPKSSVLDMQSVAFENGKPVFAKYLDSFPFPYYALVQDVNRLPGVVSDLLRQWFEITASDE
jgi:midasin